MPFESVHKVAEADFPTRWGQYRILGYEGLLLGGKPCCEHSVAPPTLKEELVALVMGDIHSAPPIVRIHSQCLTGDVFGSLRCDCGPQLHGALDRIEREGRGVVVYLRGHEGRGIGLGHKIRAYHLQESGRDTVDANLELGLPVDSREYGIGAQMLVDLGVTTMRVLTNNPVKYGGLEGFGLDIVERVSLESAPNPENIGYLRTKRERMGHLFGNLGEAADDPEPQPT